MHPSWYSFHALDLAAERIRELAERERLDRVLRELGDEEPGRAGSLRRTLARAAAGLSVAAAALSRRLDARVGAEVESRRRRFAG